MNTINNHPIYKYNFPHGDINFFVDGLHSETGKAIKVVSDAKVAEAFGIKNHEIVQCRDIVNGVIIVDKGKIYRVLALYDYKSKIVNVVNDIVRQHKGALWENFCKGALDQESEPLRCVSLPLVYKALFGVELNQQQRTDLGLVIRDAIPEVKNRPKVLTVHLETKQSIWILHYTVDDLPKITEAMLSMHGY